MNRRRQQTKSFSVTMFGVILAALIVAAGGIYYALLKNHQIQIRREIDALERNVEQRRMEIRTMEMRMDLELNRFVIRQKLEEYGSPLGPIPVAVVEEVEFAPSARERSVAMHPPNP